MNFRGPTSNRFTSQRLQLHYSDWGNEGAPPLILVHGGRDHSRSWDWVAERLRHDYHVIAPDLRGHGDSAWSPDGNYAMEMFVYDLAELIRQLDLNDVIIIAHSLGGNVAIRYTGLFPETVAKLVAIEGLGPSPAMLAEREAKPMADRLRSWIADKQQAARRHPRRYASFAEALARMQAENTFLHDGQAEHLTRHGLSRNEDGSYSWKFDNYLNVWPQVDIKPDEQHDLWRAITCPTLLVYGDKSWASNPVDDRRINVFGPNARVETFKGAGHWVHHDVFEDFMARVGAFLGE